MSHSLRGVIGPRPSASEFTSRWVKAHGVLLPQEFLLIPVTESLFNDIVELYKLNRSDPFPEFSHLSIALAEAIAASSRQGPLAYIETDYFGGMGEQHAVVWNQRNVVLGPLTSKTKWSVADIIQAPESEQAINQVLRHMGVWKQGEKDEFDMLGLNNFRDTERAAKKAD